jgi:phospholipase C
MRRHLAEYAFVFASALGCVSCGAGTVTGGPSPGGATPGTTSSSVPATLPPVPTNPPGTVVTPEPSGSPNAGLLGAGKIKHIVVVIMENRTVDDLFNGFPGADTVTAGLKHDGTMQPLQSQLLEVPCDPDHSHTGWETAYDKGKNDGWDLDPPTCSEVSGVVGGFPGIAPKYANYAYVPQSEAQPYWDIASQFAFANRMFASHSGPSYTGHLYIVSGQASNQDDDPNSVIWGCDAPAGTTVNVVGASGAIVGTAFPCMDNLTLADRLDQANIPWMYYSNNEDVDTTGLKTEEDDVPYDAIKHIRYGPDWTKNFTLDDSEFLIDVLNGTLPTFSWLNPPIVASDHPGGITEGDTGLGPDYNAEIVNTVMSSKYAQDTAIIITWDDFGGFYDHVTPTEIDDDGLGYRVPLLVVSPYAKHGYISTVHHEYGSIIKFSEEVLGVPSLGSTDVRADDLSDMFDFNQTPPAYVPIQTTYARTRRERLDRLRYWENYPVEIGPLDSQ